MTKIFLQVHFPENLQIKQLKFLFFFLNWNLVGSLSQPLSFFPIKIENPFSSSSKGIVFVPIHLIFFVCFCFWFLFSYVKHWTMGSDWLWSVQSQNVNVVSLFSGKISLLFALFKQLGVLFLTFNDLKWVIFLIICFSVLLRLLGICLN